MTFLSELNYGLMIGFMIEKGTFTLKFYSNCKHDDVPADLKFVTCISC